jgi:hypothetical protein
MICDQCGIEHPPSELERTFRRPDAVAALAPSERAQRALANDDLCVLDGQRFFVRAVLPLRVHDWPQPYRIGVWAEVSQASFDRIYALWSAPDQVREPAFEATLANHIQQLPETLGLAVQLRLSGPTTRPQAWVAQAGHPLHAQQQAGISAHQALAYNARPG